MAKSYGVSVETWDVVVDPTAEVTSDSVIA
jgi:hypothetical protein